MQRTFDDNNEKPQPKEDLLDREWQKYCDDVSEQQRIEDTLGENAFAMIYGDRRLGHEAYHQRQTAHTEP